MVGDAKKFLLLTLVWLVLTAVLLEASVPLLPGKYALKRYFRRSITPANLTVDNVRRFFDSKAFDPDLGWDSYPIARNYVATKQYLAQSYGDSFVHGDEVGPEDTWQAHFEQLTGKAILNLGVGGYGLDQAVLKFEKYARHYSTRIGILGLYNQTFRRSLSYHSFYYFTNDDAFMFVFKPMFFRRGERFELIRPPCADAACLVQVLSHPDNEVWKWLARYDYWYHVNKEKPVRRFPYTISYARALLEVLRERREKREAENFYFVNAGALDVVEYLIKRFVSDSRDMDMTPVYVLLYSAWDLRAIKAGILADDKLRKFLVAQGIPYVDTAPYILDHYRGDDRFAGLAAPLGHLNNRGNRLVAEALAEGLVSMTLLGH